MASHSLLSFPPAFADERVWAHRKRVLPRPLKVDLVAVQPPLHGSLGADLDHPLPASPFALPAAAEAKP